MGKIKSFDTFINENYKTDAVFDLAAEVYDIIDYKDIENKTKVKSALKTLGYGTDPLTVGSVIRKMKEVANESEVNEKRIRFRGKNVADLAKIVSNSTAPSIFANGENYTISPSELDSDLKGTIIYATDQEGAEFEVAIKDIEFVELYEN